MSQADYYPNGNHSACDTIHFPFSTIILPLQGIVCWESFRRALPYAIADCPYGATTELLLNLYK
ncbi:MAG: hypothetical protein LBE12_12400 [Planctomycetaceae bacterium]|nr:hypothetical protein [Planctomycetaceae bacterium]